MTTTQEERASPGWVPDDSTFGARLALVRQRMQWGNVKEAALACGIPIESWRNWERDGVAPRAIVDVAAKVAERTGCDFGWLLAGPRLGVRPGGAEVTRRYRHVPAGVAVERPTPLRPPAAA